MKKFFSTLGKILGYLTDKAKAWGLIVIVDKDNPPPPPRKWVKRIGGLIFFIGIGIFLLIRNEVREDRREYKNTQSDDNTPLSEALSKHLESKPDALLKSLGEPIVNDEYDIKKFVCK